MTHTFDVEVALVVGIKAAILFQNIAFWCEHSAANNSNYHDGEYWTYASNKALQELFPYLSERQIRESIKKLLDNGLIKKGNYNKLAFDRTIWYSLTENGKSMRRKCQMEATKTSNGSDQNVRPIPDVITDVISDNSIDRASTPSKKRKAFTKPTVEEIAKYAQSIDYNLDAQYFYNYYDIPERNWKRNGKHINWKLSVQTWKRNDELRGLNTHAKPARPVEEELDADQLRALEEVRRQGIIYG